MTKQNKYIALHGGKECKPINPHPAPKGFTGGTPITLWHDFENNAQTYPLTEVMPDGVEFECELKYYYEPQDEDYLEWREIDKAHYERIEKWNATDYRNRIPLSKMVKPLKAIEPVKEATANIGDGKSALCSAIANTLVDVVENKEEAVGTKKYKPEHIQFLQNILNKHGIENIDATKEIIDAYHYKFSASWHRAGFDDARVYFEANTAPAVDELNLHEDNENISHLAGLPLSEIYLHGVIAGKDKRIKQLKKDLANNHASFVALVEGEIKHIQSIMETRDIGNNFLYHCEVKIATYTDLLTKIK